MTWIRELEKFIFTEEFMVQKDIIETEPSDFRHLKFMKGLQVHILQLGDLKCIWTDKLTDKFYREPQLTIYYVPFAIDELYVQLKYLNCFNGNKHLWQAFLNTQNFTSKPFECNDYSGNMNNILLKLFPAFVNNQVIVVDWTMKDVQLIQQEIFKNIQKINLDEDLSSKLALLFLKMKKGSVNKQELIECYKHFNSYLFDYTVDKFMKYINQYLPSYLFESLEDLFFTLKLLFAIEKTGLPLHLASRIKSQIVNWHVNTTIEVDSFEIPFFDSIAIKGNVGIEEVSVEISSTFYGTKCLIEKKHVLSGKKI